MKYTDRIRNSFRRFVEGDDFDDLVGDITRKVDALRDLAGRKLQQADDLNTLAQKARDQAIKLEDAAARCLTVADRYEALNL